MNKGGAIHPESLGFALPQLRDAVVEKVMEDD